MKMIREKIANILESIANCFDTPPTNSKTYIFYITLFNNDIVEVEKTFSWFTGGYHDYIKEGHLKDRVLEYQKKLALEGFRKDELYYAPASINLVTFEEK